MSNKHQIPVWNSLNDKFKWKSDIRKWHIDIYMAKYTGRVGKSSTPERAE